MGDAERRESIRQSIRRLAAIANGEAIDAMELEELELREKQLVTYFERFHALHLDIVAGGNVDDDELRRLNEELMYDTEELCLVSRARFVRVIRQKQHERQLAERVDAMEMQLGLRAAETEQPPAGIEHQAVDANVPLQEIHNRQVNVGYQAADANAEQRVAIGGEAGHLGRDEMAARIDAHEQGTAGGAHQVGDADPNLAAPFRHEPPDAETLRAANVARANENQFVVYVRNDHEIRLSTFGGDYSRWAEFRDSFRQLVHESTDKSLVSKFNILAQHLSGEAAHTIAGLTRVAENYPIAWQLLIDRYDHPKLIIETLFGQLRELRPLSDGNASGLRHVVLKYKQVLRQLLSMRCSIDETNTLLTCQLLAILDGNTRFEWESQNRSREMRPLSELLEFLDHRAECMIRAQSASGSRRAPPQQSQPAREPKRLRSAVGHVATTTERPATPHDRPGPSGTQSQCPACHGNCRRLTDCREFDKMKPFKRMGIVRKAQVCFGCLRAGHEITECTVGPCPHCTSGRQHHEMLCFAYYAQQHPAGAAPVNNATVGFVRERDQSPSATGIAVTGGTTGAIRQAGPSCQPVEALAMNAEELTFERSENPLAEIVMANQVSGALLATAIIRVRATNGEYKVIRALCDTGAQTNLITERCMQLVGAHREPSNLTLSPVGADDSLNTRGAVQVIAAPLIDGEGLFRVQIKALVLKKITSRLPAARLNIGTWPKRITDNLADPTVAEPGRIDMLLGAHVWSLIAQQGFYSNRENDLVGQQTKFGWLIFGGIAAPGETIFGHMRIDEAEPLPLDGLNRFWEPEAVTGAPERAAEADKFEVSFTSEYRRLWNGRYCVPIPMKRDIGALGRSHQTAARRFQQLERRFQRNPQFHEKYAEFMADYIRQGHARMLNKPINSTEPHYYIPHHGIDGGKFRVVFDASAPTSSGTSCNDLQVTGAKLQQDLADIFMRFRKHRWALVADVRQMYRQIPVLERYQLLQLILWRPTPKEKIRTYALTTVTYGMKHASFSAVRVLHQIADDYAESHPRASAVAKRDFYMDDLISGANTSTAAIELYREMSDMLKRGGMELRKWGTNSWTVYSEMADEDVGRDMSPIALYDRRSVLGIYWELTADQLEFKVHASGCVESATKRQITSEVAKIFDPTGLVAPITIRGKLIVRELWARKYGWDEEVSPDILGQWRQLHAELNGLSSLRVPRWLGTGAGEAGHLHVFCGATTNAFAAAVYSCATNDANSVIWRLVAAKTRVAPSKPTSVHRLHISAAALAVKLLEQAERATGAAVRRCWTSSKVVLEWIEQEPQNYQAFVANRIKAIQGKAAWPWGYIEAEENPAEIAASGSSVEQLLDNELWWQGPHPFWEPAKPELSIQEHAAVENEQRATVIGVIEEVDRWIADRYSSATRLVTITAIVKKCVKKWRKKANAAKMLMAEAAVKSSTETADERLTENVTRLTRAELIDSERFWVIRAQRNAFPTEIASCLADKRMSTSSRLTRLAPFVHKDGTLRVGGRLQNANLTFDEMFPAILPAEDSIVRLLIERAHRNTLHGGPQVTSQELRKHYWLIGGRNPVRKVVHKCTTCVRHRGKPADQQLAALVPGRTRPGRPFETVSIDYCGPFEVKRYSGRCGSKIKCYVAVFVCMWSRAMHFEVVSDLTADGFIDAYQRFAARRGHAIRLISDNATTFVGAKTKIDAIRKNIEDGAQRSLFRENRIDWQFIAPRAPWQGGSHEAAVKLLKHHLRRELNGRSISITEFATLITRIEGCVNSRPLGAISEDGTDSIALSPMHLLVGSDPSYATVEADATERKTFANKYQVIQQAHQMFWRKWRTSYLNHLQMRNKRMRPQRNVEAGDIVLLKDEGAPPQQWPMGKIEAVYPGQDGLVRNVAVRANGKMFKRAVQSLIPLLAAEEEGAETGDQTPA